MDKIQLVVLGLSASPTGNNAYALILKEVDGDKRLPIVIGSFEAQSIALEMEGVIPPRPMTHDLIKHIIEGFGASIVEVHIDDLNEGTFYAKLIFDMVGTEIDCRPSDAIALAIRFNCPIYVNSDILEEVGVLPFEDSNEPVANSNMQYNTQQKTNTPNKPESKIDNLQNQLNKAISDEDYEKAAKLRDELKRILEN